MFYFLFYFFQREISEMHGLTNAKFCTVVSTRPNFIMPVQNFWRAHSQKISGPKACKIWTGFGPVLDDFEVWRRISLKQMKIFKIG